MKTIEVLQFEDILTYPDLQGNIIPLFLFG